MVTIPHTHCHQTTKRRYASEAAALYLNRDLPIPASAYFCRRCRGFHITRKPNRAVTGNPRLLNFGEGLLRWWK
jgi:hypothetical protein